MSSDFGDFLKVAFRQGRSGDELVGFALADADFQSNSEQYGVTPTIFRDFFHGVVELLCLKHLSYGREIDAKPFCSSAICHLRKYFFEDWATSAFGPDGEPPEAEWQLLTDKTRPESCEWYEVFTHGLLPSLLVSTEETKSIAAWVEPQLRAEYAGGKFEDELGILYGIVCHDFTGRDYPSRAAALSSLCKSRTKFLRELSLAWQSVADGNHSGFWKHFELSVAAWSKIPIPRASLASDYVSLHHSNLWLLAEATGVPMGELPDAIRSRFLTRDSVSVT